MQFQNSIAINFIILIITEVNKNKVNKSTGFTSNKNQIKSNKNLNGWRLGVTLISLKYFIKYIK